MNAGSSAAGAPGRPGDDTRVDRLMLDWMHDLAPFGIFATDTVLRITSWNRWLGDHSNRPAADVIGRPLAHLFPEIAERKLDEHYTRALRGEVSVLSTALHKHLLQLPADSHLAGTGWMLQTARIGPLRDDQRIVGTITIIEDVTQRELQARAIQWQHHIDQLLSRALGSLLASNNPEGDLQGILLALSPTLGVDVHLHYSLVGSAGTLELHSCSGISPRPKETLSRVQLDTGAESPSPQLELQPLRDALAPLELAQSFLFPLVIAERVLGVLMFGSYAPDRITDENQGVLARIAQYSAIVLDRAQRERAMQAASRAKDDFLAALSHELRAPLNPVLLTASDGAVNENFNTAAREAFRFIEKNALLEARLIDDLLDITRIEHGKLPLDLRPTDVHEAIRNALVTVEHDARERRIALHLDLEAGRPEISADEVRLQQIFWNVLKNAVKFSPDEGVVQVRTETTSDQAILIEVIDSGIGMEPHEVARLFSAFSQGDHAQPGGAHRFGGLGLGLAITHRLVHLHDGSITAHSLGRNRGSMFRLRFSLLVPREEEPAGGATSRREETDTPAAPAPRAFHLLLVEDHEPTRSTMERLLRRRGFEVTAVESARAALARAALEKYDLVVSDIGLPDSDGFSLMRKLRESHGMRGIALTGYGMDADQARSRDAGFVTHLTKPVSVEALSRALADALG